MPGQNPRTRDIKARALAIDVLVSVREWPHVEKEELFAVALAYYRWELAHSDEEELLAAYTDEFMYQHNAAVQQLDGALQKAAFLTWFIANSFHRLPVFRKEDAVGLHGEVLHFSLPCFYLPTDSRDHTFLVQWFCWLEGHRHGSPPGDTLLYRWSREMTRHVPHDCGLNRDALVEQCCSFLSWCYTVDYDLDIVRSCLKQFMYEQESARRWLDQPEVWDAHFLAWFTGRILSRLDWEDAS